MSDAVRQKSFQLRVEKAIYFFNNNSSYRKSDTEVDTHSWTDLLLSASIDFPQSAEIIV